MRGGPNELDASELDLFARQLGPILAYADQVQRVDTTGVPPTASVVTRHSFDRPDEVRPSLDVHDALANPDLDRHREGRVLFRLPGQLQGRARARGLQFRQPGIA